MESSISSTAPQHAGAMTWQIAQVFWVGGVWVMHFVLLKALENLGFTNVLVEEVAMYMRPLLIGLAGLCVILQLLVLGQAVSVKRLFQDVRGQLLLASLLLSCSFLLTHAFLPSATIWLEYSYVLLGMCGLLLVIQPVPQYDPATSE